MDSALIGQRLRQLRKRARLTQTELGARSGGIRAGAAGHDVCFVHPKGSPEAPRSGEGVLIELIQAPPAVIAAFAVIANA